MLLRDRFLTGLLSALLAGGCASAPPISPPATTQTRPSPPPGPVSSCSPGQPDSPADLRDKLRAKRDDIQRCTLLGSHGSEATVIRLDLQVSDHGAIKRLDLTSALALDPTVHKCCEDSIREVSFGAFCGDDVEVHWTYEFQ